MKQRTILQRATAFLKWTGLIPGNSANARLKQPVALLSLIFAAIFPLSSIAQLSDDFTTDTSLNDSLWITSSGQLTGLATEFNSSLLAPLLNFGPMGMTLSGVNHSNELAGVQSFATFQPPFTVTTTVTADLAHGNAFEFFLVSADLTQWLNVGGNLNPGNGSYFGLWVNYDNSGLPFLSLGNTLYSDPTTNAQYTLQIFVENNGVAAVSLFSSSGDVLGILPGLNVGSGPFYVILGQREGGPHVPGANIATWENIFLVQATPPPLLGPITWAGGAAKLTWSTVAGASYQVQYTTSLPPAQWIDLGPPVTANATVATTTDFFSTGPQRFYRVVVLP